MGTRRRKISFGDITIVPVWSDSMGAKSFSVFIDTNDVKILIDPGVSVMQPSFPASDAEKFKWVEKAWSQITRYAKQADIITITHYHYDHFSPDAPEIYENKLILAKNPNQFINESQRERALEFYTYLYKRIAKKDMSLLKREETVTLGNPLEELPKAMSIDYGEYESRKKELLRKGKKWFDNLVTKWNKWPLIPEFKLGSTECLFADGKKFKFGSTIIRFTEPRFHGIEFSRVGWVIPIIIETGSLKILYTSDLNGPIIEDYADWIIKEKPDVLLIDGPATYMIPYTLNMINFRRALRNIEMILKKTNTKIIFLDHHLTRDIRFKQRLKSVYELAKESKKRVLTFSEWYGRKTIAEKIFLKKEREKKK